MKSASQLVTGYREVSISISLHSRCRMMPELSRLVALHLAVGCVTVNIAD